MKTYTPKAGELAEAKWWILDAEEMILGRLATRAATLLRGKHKPTYAPHVDEGDYVIVVNAEKINVTGLRREQKKYYRHSGYPGGIREETLEELLARRPERVIRLAVKGMFAEPSGLEPEAVARIALDGVAAGHFWIFTHDALRPVLEARLSEILEAHPRP